MVAENYSPGVLGALGKFKVGDVVRYCDRSGEQHNALVIYVWSTSLNIVYVGREPRLGSVEFDDSLGNERIVETSVPFYEEGMSGHYIFDSLRKVKTDDLSKQV